MLVISPQATAALDDYARPAFAVRVRKALAEKYPHFLPRFPENLQDAITGNMLNRGSLWGLRLQTGLLAYCELMISIAANFDEEPEIHGVLQDAPDPKDYTVTALPQKVSKPAWTRAERRASNLPFYIPPSLVGAANPDQTVAALPIALFNQPDAQNARAAVAAALGQAGELNMKHLPDAGLVIAACRSFFGPGFAAMAWMAEAQQERMPPDVMLETMRLRLALDFGRFV